MTAKTTTSTLAANTSRSQTADAFKAIFEWAGFTCSTPADVVFNTLDGIGVSTTLSVFTATNNTTQCFIRVLCGRQTIAGLQPGFYVYFQMSPDNTFATLAPTDAIMNLSYTTSPRNLYSGAALNAREASSATQFLVGTRDIRITAYTSTTNDLYLGIGVEMLGFPLVMGKTRSSVLFARVCENVQTGLTSNNGLDTWGCVGFPPDKDDAGPGLLVGASDNTTASGTVGFCSFWTPRVLPPSASAHARFNIDSLCGPGAFIDSTRASMGVGPMMTEDAWSGISLTKGNPLIYISAMTSGRNQGTFGAWAYMGDLSSDIAWGPGCVVTTGARVVVSPGVEEYECLAARTQSLFTTTAWHPSSAPYFRVV